MLCGDMEVSQVTTKPGYLIDWKYDDTTTTGSFMSSDKATIGTDTSNYTSPSTTMVPEALQSLGNGTKPILHDIIDRRGTRVHQLSSFHNMEVEDAERSMVQDNWEQQQEYHNKHPSTLEMIHPIGLWKN
ncbi:hypothetical protein ACOSQ2_028007 [Xanthoceras sorbifolium]